MKTQFPLSFVALHKCCLNTWPCCNSSLWWHNYSCTTYITIHFLSNTYIMISNKFLENSGKLKCFVSHRFISMCSANALADLLLQPPVPSCLSTLYIHISAQCTVFGVPWRWRQQAVSSCEPRVFVSIAVNSKSRSIILVCYSASYPQSHRLILETDTEQHYHRGKVPNVNEISYCIIKMYVIFSVGQSRIIGRRGRNRLRMGCAIYSPLPTWGMWHTWHLSVSSGRG
jgi:hypothetical protein